MVLVNVGNMGRKGGSHHVKKQKNVVRGGVGFSLLIPIPPTKTIAAVENHVLTHKTRLIAVTDMADLW